MTSVIIDAVRHFAVSHDIELLSGEGLDELVGHVDGEDYDAMYETVGNLISFVPTRLHQELFDVVSCALSEISGLPGHDENGGDSEVRKEGDDSADEEFFEKLRQTVGTESAQSDAGRGAESPSGGMHDAEERSESEWRVHLQHVLAQNEQLEATLDAECARIDAMVDEIQTKQHALADVTKKVSEFMPRQAGRSDAWAGLLDETDGFVLHEEAVREERHLRTAGVFEHAGVRKFGTSYFGVGATKMGSRHAAVEEPSNDDKRELMQRGAPNRMQLVRAFGCAGQEWTMRERKVLQSIVMDRVGADSAMGSQQEVRDSDRLKEIVEGWDSDKWEMIVRTDGWRLGQRSSEDLMCRYLNREAPWLEAEKDWTDEEDDTVRQGREKDWGWGYVADALPRRTALECLRRWRHLKDGELRSGRQKWTRAEDELLAKAVGAVGRGDWARVALMMGSGKWNGQQCMHRFVKRVDTGRRVGKWSEAEVEKLKAAMEQVREEGGGGGGKNRVWTQVAKKVGTRNDVQCREKWVNCLDERVKRRGWICEEDVKLQRAVQRIGVGKWADVAREMDGRTDAQCQRRWKVISRKRQI